MVTDPPRNHDCAPAVAAGVGFFHLGPGHYSAQKQDSTTAFELGAVQMSLGCRSGGKSLGKARKIALAWWSPKISVSNQRDTRVNIVSLWITLTPQASVFCLHWIVILQFRLTGTVCTSLVFPASIVRKFSETTCGIGKRESQIASGISNFNEI